LGFLNFPQAHHIPLNSWVSSSSSSPLSTTFATFHHLHHSLSSYLITT
jgi:hypothetical protein